VSSPYAVKHCIKSLYGEISLLGGLGVGRGDRDQHCIVVLELCSRVEGEEVCAVHVVSLVIGHTERT